MTALLRNIPNILTAFRLAASPALVALLWHGHDYAALFVFVLRAGHHVHFSAAPSDFDRSSEPSSAGPDDLGAPQGPLTMNTDFGDGGSEAD